MTDQPPYSYREGESLVFVGARIRFQTSEASFQLFPLSLAWASVGARSANPCGMCARFEGPGLQFASDVEEFFVGELLELSSSLEQMLAGERERIEFPIGSLAYPPLRFALSRDARDFVLKASSASGRYDEATIRDARVQVSLAFRLTIAEIDEARRDLAETLRLCDRFADET